jgi:hypothetical protein
LRIKTLRIHLRILAELREIGLGKVRRFAYQKNRHVAAYLAKAFSGLS